MEVVIMEDHGKEVSDGNRFEFGSNWAKFLELLSEDKIQLAEASLKDMLGVTELHGKTFLDIGSGSGLFSLAARRLGATVHSFDYDPMSVACTKELKRRYFDNDHAWVVEQESALNSEYTTQLGQFDVVYSWGVLHHTGSMWQALKNTIPMVKKDGRLFVAIYNNQGSASEFWLLLKKIYNRLPRALRWLVVMPAFIRLWGPTTVRDFLRAQPFFTWKNYSNQRLRGMSPWCDLIDWVGGLPFEVATPEEIFDFYRKSGFTLDRLKTCAGGHGCNEFIFTRLQ